MALELFLSPSLKQSEEPLAKMTSLLKIHDQSASDRANTEPV
jgi:hypothetical protein